MNEPATIIADLMLAEAGVHEIPGPKAAGRILEYDQHTTLKATSDEVAWCSAALCFVVDKARETHPGIDPSTRSAAASSWASWGLEVPDGGQDKGDVVVFNHHVAVYLKEDDEHPGLIQIVGGNQGDLGGGPDAVNVKWRRLDGVLHFRRPKHYEEA